MPENPSDGAPPSGAEKSVVEIGREIGALEKQLRATERRQAEAAPPYRQKFGPKHILFEGGAKQSHAKEDVDEAFRAADIMRGREAVTDEVAQVVYYKRGPKKGTPKFTQPRKHVTLAERNEKNLRKYVGKKIRLIVKFQHVSRGGLKVVERRKTREIVYRDYKNLIDVYSDVMRQTIKRKSPDAYYIRYVQFDKPIGRKPSAKKKATKGKRKRKSRAKKKDAAARAAAV